MGSKSFESWIWNAPRVSIGEVFLQHQLWIVNYYVKSLSNNLIIENIRAGVSREMIMIFQKKVHFCISIHICLENNNVYVFITEIIWLTFDENWQSIIGVV